MSNHQRLTSTSCLCGFEGASWRALNGHLNGLKGKACGAANARWNNGRWRHPDGYIGIAVPSNHHLRQAHGYAFEHQIVAEAVLGRRLRKGEVVHHKNGKRDDNRPENLDVMMRSDHARDHVSLPGVRDNLGRFNDAPRHGGDWNEWPDDLQVREFPRVRK